MAIFHGNSISAGGGGYTIDNSLRFNDDDSPYMTFTPSSAGNRKTFTISLWFKRGNIDGLQHVLCAAESSDKITLLGDYLYADIAGITSEASASEQTLLRDPSAWYHLVLAVDTTQGTSTDRIKWYLNGSQMTTMTAVFPSLNADSAFNNNTAQRIGTNPSPGFYYDGYIAEFHMVDGTALDQTSFGETGDYGEWKPIEYTGSHGTNGYYLDFSNAGQTQVGQGVGTAIGTHTAGGNLSAAFDGTTAQAGSASANTSGSTLTSFLGKNWGTDYSNNCGTGDRRSIITVTTDLNIQSGVVTSLVDGAIGTSNGWYPVASQNAAGKYIRFQLSYAKAFNDVTFRTAAADGGLGIWKFQGSNDATTWTDLSGDVTLGNAITESFSLNNTTAYTYYQAVGVSGTPIDNWIYEFEFGEYTGVTKTISGFKVYASSNEGLTGSSANTSGCTLTLYGNSVDNTGTATNLGSMTGLNFRTNSATHIKLSGLNVSTAYQYHWIKFTVPNSATMFCAELEFFEGAPGFGLGIDSAGSNHFTLTNITSSDQVTDSPTNNFAVMNNMNNQPFVTTFAEGNLEITTGGQGQEPSNMATMGMTSGKWYFEVQQSAGASFPALGIRADQAGTISPEAKDNPGRSPSGYAYIGAVNQAGNILNNDSYSSYGTLVGYGNGDLISMAVDLDNNKMYWAKNGVYLNSANPSSNSNGFSITPVNQTNLGAYFPCFGDVDLSSYVFNCNFGQDGTFNGNVTAGGNSDDNGIGNFKYAPPTGFLSLCTANLPEPTVTPSEHFNAIAYTGDGSQDVTGVGFQPDLVWCKTRNNTYHHQLHDSVRGATAGMLNSNQTATENSTFQFDSFDSDGFTTDSGNVTGINASGDPQLALCWKSGTTTSGTTSGVGTGKAYSASYNASAGVSIVSYLGNGSVGHTIPHHLGVAPELMIMTERTSTDGWYVYSSPMGNTKGMQLNEQNAPNTTSAYWNNTSPTSSVWTVSNNSGNNSSDAAYIAYCFHSVEGYSKIGSYKGNGSTDGAFVYTGFKPAFVICKKIDASGGWIMHDNARNLFNLTNYGLLANTPAAETSSDNQIDLLSNGFKRRATDGHGNATNDYLYYAIAEQPFKHTNAR